MPLQMVGRPIMRKQTAYRLYSPSAVALANTLADIPFSATRIFVTNVIIYFMSGLARNAGGLFTFHIMIYTAFLAIQGLFRTFGMLCKNFDSAFRISTFILPNL
jgi:ATP-binding cassette, subfamily G (WHITE), member 2, SNQ2